MAEGGFHFTLIEPLGGGGFGTAFLVKHTQFGKIVFKKIEISDDHDLKKTRFQHECGMHKHLHHPNIVHFFGVYSVETTCGLFLEYMQYGEVSDFIKEFDVTWQWKTQIVRDVAQAMVYLHTQQPCIIHGDLKPQNILIDSQYRAKVSDFGLACSQTMPTPDGIPRCGTPPYIAPEYLEDKSKQKTTEYDVYGFAISIWEIYSGKRHSDDFQVANLTGQFVINGFRPSIEDITTLHNIPESIWQLIEQCWNQLENSRPPFEHIERILSIELDEIGEVLQAPEKITNQEPFSTQIEHTTGTLDSNSEIEIETVEDREQFITGFNKVWLSLKKYLDSENGLLECLTFNGVLTDTEYDVLIEITPNEQRNGRLLQQFIKQKITEKFTEFVKALIDNEQKHIVTHIMSSGLNRGEDRLLTRDEIKIIDNNMFGLINLIQPYKKKFLYRLVSKNCITSTQKDKIESNKDFPEKVDELLKILKRRRYIDLRNFKQCLHDTMQNKLVELFEKSGLVAIRVQLVNRPDICFIESVLIAHMTDFIDYADENNDKTLTAEQRQFVGNLLKELERADIRILGTSAWHSMAVFFMCSSDNSLQEIRNKFETGRLKKILESIYRVLYKLPNCAPDLIESISLIHEQQHSKSCSGGVLSVSEEHTSADTVTAHNPPFPPKERGTKALNAATKSISRAEDARNDTKLLMQPYANWEHLLVPIPTIIGILGELVFISSAKDFAIDKNIPRGGYQFIRYPDSFRACLMQVVNAGWRAFSEAHKNMDQIRLHSGNVGKYIKQTVKILMQTDDQLIAKMLPIYLGNIKTIARTCTELAEATENKFTFAISLIQELLEACVNAQRAYGKLKEETEKAITVHNMKLKAAEENKRRTEELLKSMNKQMEQAQNDYKKAMDSIPSGWEVIGLNFVEGIANSVYIAFNGVMKNLAGGGTKKNETEDPQQDPNANNAVYSKSSMLMNLADTMMNEFVNQGQIEWDQQQDRSGPKYLQKLFQEVEDYVIKNEKCKATKPCIDICKNAIEICETLERGKPDGTDDDGLAAKLIEDLANLRDMCSKFDTQSKIYTGSSAFPVKPPQLTAYSGNTYASTVALEKARFCVEQTRAQLKETIDRVEKTTKNMNKAQEQMTKTLIELQSWTNDKIDDAKTFEILLKIMLALGSVQEQWEKISRFFQMISSIIETSLKTSLHDFIHAAENTNSMVEYSSKHFMKDMLYQEAFQSSNIASLVNMIAGTYVEVSDRFVMAQISSLGKIMGLDPNSSYFNMERIKLSEGVRDADEGIKLLVVSKNNEFKENASARLAKIESQMQAVLPPATENENQKIKSIIESGIQEMWDLTPDEEDRYQML